MYIKDNKIYVELPEGTVFDYNNRITATVTDKDNNPVKDMSVMFTDSAEKTETNHFLKHKKEGYYSNE